MVTTFHPEGQIVSCKAGSIEIRRNCEALQIVIQIDRNECYLMPEACTGAPVVQESGGEWMGGSLDVEKKEYTGVTRAQGARLLSV